MNLFLIGWNVSEKLRVCAKDALVSMPDVYPNLDIDMLWSYGNGSPVFAAGITNKEELCLPRRYVHKEQDSITFYDGCLIDFKNRFIANDAAQLEKHWGSIADTLEGQFVIVNACTNPPGIEIINDVLGVYQVFFTRIENTWLVSNSVGLLGRVTNFDALDMSGVASFLGFGWAGGDRTLKENIRVIPAGQHWIWKEGDHVNKNTYFKRESLARIANKNSPKSVSHNLSSELSRIVGVLSNNYSLLEAPITAGRDSRAIVSLLVGNNIDAKYFTAGDKESIDVQIADLIAKKFNLDHAVNRNLTTDKIVIENWQEACQRVVDINDGMVSLAHIKNAARPLPIASELYVHFYGAGGEIGRAFYEEDRYYIHRHTEKFVRDYLSERLMRKNGLFSPNVNEQCEAFLTRFIDGAMNDGFSATDLPAVFYAYERTRRWGGANFRQISSYRDVFSPFCTRAFLQASFSISSLHRYSDSLHYYMMETLVPEVLSIPFDKPLHSQVSMQNLAGFFYKAVAGKWKKKFPSLPKTEKRSASSTAFTRNERSMWFEEMLGDIRQTCLDESKSAVWDFVNKSEFERLTLKDTPAVERHKNIQVLYDIYTLFYYADKH